MFLSICLLNCYRTLAATYTAVINIGSNMFWFAVQKSLHDDVNSAFGFKNWGPKIFKTNRERFSQKGAQDYIKFWDNALHLDLRSVRVY